MPTLQSSGQISISDLNTEAGYDEDARDSSLTTLANAAAALAAKRRPNMTVGAPHSLSEFYGVDAP